MYSVSSEYLEAFRKLYRTDRITGRIKLKNGTNIEISDSILVQGKFAITRKVCGGSFDVGTFYAGEVAFSLRDEAANSLDFGGAVIAADYEIMTGGTETEPVWESVPLGVFYIDGKQTTRRGKQLNLRGYDGTSKFDIDLPSLTAVATLWDALVQACLRANVGLAVTENWFSSLPNASAVPDFSSKQIQSCRDLVMWIAQTVGCYAYIDRNGFLQMKRYYYAGDGSFDRAILATERTKIEYTDTRTYLAYLTSYSGNSPKLYQDIKEWTGSDTIKGGGLSLPNNPLLKSLSAGQQDEINATIMANWSYPTRYIKSQGFVDPAIDPLDVLAFTGGTIDIGQIISVCTEIKWRFRGAGHLICNNLDQYTEDADMSDAVAVDDETATQAADQPKHVPIKSQSEKRMDELFSNYGGDSLSPLVSYAYLTDTSAKFNGTTYTVEKDASGLIVRITDSKSGAFVPEVSGEITDVAFHNAVFMAVAMVCGLGKTDNTLVLYDEGDECSDITGGWRLWHNANATATEIKYDDYMYIKSENTGTQYAFVLANTYAPIDLTKYTKLHFEVIAPTTNESVYSDYGISVDEPNDTWSNITQSGFFGRFDERTDVVMDITDRSGLYYVNLLVDRGNELKIYKVWLEK